MSASLHTKARALNRVEPPFPEPAFPPIYDMITAVFRAQIIKDVAGPGAPCHHTERLTDACAQLLGYIEQRDGRRAADAFRKGVS